MKRDLPKNPVEIDLFPLTSKQATLIEIENSKKILDFIENLTGNQAPDFVLKDINGKPISLNDLRGTIVVLNFWFVDCAPCVREMPELNALKEKYKGKRIAFLGLALDDVRKINSFRQKQNFEYHILPNAKAVMKLYGILAYLTHIVIEQNGKISVVQVGGHEVTGKLIKVLVRRT